MSNLIYEHKVTKERVRVYAFESSDDYKGEIPDWLVERDDYLRTNFGKDIVLDDDLRVNDLNFIRVDFKKNKEEKNSEYYYITEGQCLVQQYDKRLVIMSNEIFRRIYYPIVEVVRNYKTLQHVYNQLKAHIEIEYKDNNIKPPIDLHFMKVLCEYHLGINKD